MPPVPRPTFGKRSPAPRIDNAPNGILDAWTALEVLSPRTFRQPETLADGDRRAVAWLDRGHLPWEGGGERARPKTRLFYQLVLGTVDFEATISHLLARYTDSRVERPTARGEAILAVAIVDREGRLVEMPSVSVSSFAWGAPRALRGELGDLAEWRTAEQPLVEGLDEILRRDQDDEEAPPLDRATIMAGYEWLVASLNLPSELVKPPRFAIRSHEYYQNPDPPEPLLLNSFFLKDLAAAKTLFSEGQATLNLRRYLGCDGLRSSSWCHWSRRRSRPSSGCWVIFLRRDWVGCSWTKPGRPLALLRCLAEAAIVPDLYIVTPFVIVADNLRKLVRESGVLAEWTDDPWRWTSERIGTVHTVQGREAEAVIFVLGAPAPHQTGARGWAGGRPNLLNVAVTRAKERLYVVGNRSLWREAGLFRELDARLPEWSDLTRRCSALSSG